MWGPLLGLHLRLPLIISHISSNCCLTSCNLFLFVPLERLSLPWSWSIASGVPRFPARHLPARSARDVVVHPRGVPLEHVPVGRGEEFGH